MGPRLTIRRATLEDLPVLVELWRSMRFNADGLVRQLTEFQVAVAEGGEIVGAVGLRITDKQGCIHSEGFTDFTFAEYARPLLWDRLNSLAVNHGLLRLWTREQAPFWNHCGMQKAGPDAVQRLPAAWPDAKSPDWLTLKLREDVDALISADQEFALFMQAQREQSRRRLQQVKVIKWVAAVIAFGIFLLVLAGAVYLIRRNPGLRLPHG